VAGRVLLVVGGSLGAKALNEVALEAFGAEGPAVLQLGGERYAEELAGRTLRPDYKLLAWTDDFGAALAAADLVLGRAGGSVWEVAAAGKPAVLVPSPNVTADHQTKNARYFEAAGGAVVVPEPELARVPDVVRTLLADDARLAAMGDAMRRAAKPNAADEIAEELIALASA
jgi:UDP-N-acetylglucosamine--N-acetylmuramyl-(pentapeptide) pyrophosphoryl-undecaprenol N-acetylglucosamine transferase